MTDEDWARFGPAERRFAMRWVSLDGEERDVFLRDLLAAIEVLQRLGVLAEPDTTAAAWPRGPGDDRTADGTSRRPPDASQSVAALTRGAHSDPSPSPQGPSSR